MTTQVEAGKFEARCLELMDKVAETREPIVITRNGRPIATLHPYVVARPSLHGAWKDRIEIVEDIVAPVEVELD